MFEILEHLPYISVTDENAIMERRTNNETKSFVFHIVGKLFTFAEEVSVKSFS